MIHVVRHADALARARWEDDDVRRPLTRTGAKQASALADLLAPHHPGVLLTSPAVRCRETLDPLAARLAVTLRDADFLAEGGSGQACLAGLLAAGAGAVEVVACTHGDVLLALLDTLADEGIPFESAPAIPKAGTWELTVSGGRVTGARLEGPPKI